MQALNDSVIVSADNAHSVHPNHPELSDPTNKVFMNKGVVIKRNANERYTTDAISEAVIIDSEKTEELRFIPEKLLQIIVFVCIISPFDINFN